MRRKLAALPVVFALTLLSFTKTRGEEPPLPKIGTWLGKAVESPRGRSPFGGDVFLEKWVETGEFPSPKEGEDGWEKLPLKVDFATRREDVSPPFATGYAWTTIESEAERVVLIEAHGHGYLALNGKPLGGDVYRAACPPLPALLKRGTNRLVVRVARGPFSLKLDQPPRGSFSIPEDATLPDVRAGQPLDSWGQVVLVNPGQSTSRFEIEARGEGLETTRSTVEIAPLTATKAAFRIKTKGAIADVPSVSVTVAKSGGQSETTFTLRVRSPAQTWKETFRSEIDGSVQYFAVRPPRKVEPGKKYGLVLSLHGASVEATGMVDAYSPKEWCYVVSPTNRRPFGFDWEDWGRDDALEVLAQAKERLPIDPLRVHLVGHSMGGHGAWHVGVTFPDKFACVSPSAGWVSFWSYVGAPKAGENDKCGEIFARVMGPSDTLSLSPNLKDLGVYIIHGEQDDNVSIGEALKITKELEKQHHPDLRFHREPGAGHWWSKAGEDGTACIDLADMFSFLSRRVRDEAPRSVSFRTWNPGISSRSSWVEISQQDRHLALSTIDARISPATRTVTVKTENVAVFELDLARFLEPGEVKIERDGKSQDVRWDGKKPLRVGSLLPADPEKKNPARYGPFKRAFERCFVFVYGELDKAAYDKARYDAQTWGYRANGSVELVSADAFNPDDFADRSVVLYGNRSSNAAFDLVLDPLPLIDVENGKVRIGEKTLEGPDLACLYALPRKGSDKAMVAVVGGTSAQAMRLTMAAPFLTSGVAYPDFVVFDSKVLTKGLEGVRACGILDESWGLGGNALTYFAK